MNENFILAEKGKPLSVEQSRILKLLKVPMGEFKINVVCVWERKTGSFKKLWYLYLIINLILIFYICNDSYNYICQFFNNYLIYMQYIDFSSLNIEEIPRSKNYVKVTDTQVAKQFALSS